MADLSDLRADVMPTGLIDSHCHLELLRDTEGDLAAAWQQGLEAIVAIGFDLVLVAQGGRLRAPARARARGRGPVPARGGQARRRACSRDSRR